MQRVDLYQPIVSSRPCDPPLVLRVGVIKPSPSVMGGVATQMPSIETYVLLSALPMELRQRVETALAALSSF